MNLFEIMAVLTLDSSAYRKGMKDAESDAGKSGKVIKGIFGGIGKTVVAGVVAGAAAIVSLTKSAIDSYAEYEQLSQGTKLMLGDAWDDVSNRAQNAYKTLQMSANDYLTQVNGLATGLKTSLGNDEKAAADLADKIVTAEADIVAATGASQEAVQSAFNGIMKSNYTMLDNLQLGIKPTKEGMQEVIDKVNAWRESQGQLGNLTIDSLADCQAALVDYVDMMGMAGYAQAEGADTIQGSLSSLKAAWRNLLTGLADPEQDVNELLNHVIDAVGDFAGNVVPIIGNVLSSVGELIKDAAPRISDAIPKVIDTLVPLITEGAVPLITGLIEGIIMNLPKIAMAAVQIVWALIQGFNQMISNLAEAAGKVDDKVREAIMAKLGQLKEAGGRMIETIKNAITAKVSQMMTIGGNLIQGLWNGIGNKLGWLKSKISSFASSVMDSIKSFFGVHSPSTKTRWIGEMLVAGFNEGLADLTDQKALGNKIQDAIDGVTYGDYTFGKNGSGLVTVSASSAVNDVVALLETYLPRQNQVYVDGKKVSSAVSQYTMSDIAKMQRFNNMLVGVN